MNADDELRVLWAELSEVDKQDLLAAGRALRGLPPQPVHVPVMRLMGLHLKRVDTERGELEAELPVSAHLFNPGGVLHGAVAFSMADFGSGVLISLSLPPGHNTTTIELSVRYFKAVTEGRLVSHTRIINRGRRIIHTQTEITQSETGDLIALGTASFYVIAPKSG